MDLHKIPMDPTIVELGKIAVEVLLPALIAPEEARHIRKRARCDKLPWHAILDAFTSDPTSPFHQLIKDRNRRPKRRPLATTHIDGQQRIPRRERARDIRAPRDIVELDMLGEALIVEPFEQLVREHHAGARHDLQVVQIRHVLGRDVVLLHFLEIARADAEVGASQRGVEVDEGGGVGEEGTAVVHDHAAADEEGLHWMKYFWSGLFINEFEHVGRERAERGLTGGEIHDPSSCCVLHSISICVSPGMIPRMENPHLKRNAILVQTPMQPPLLMAVQHHAPDTMNQALGLPRRPTRIDDEKRIREAHPLEPQLRLPMPHLQILLPPHHPLQPCHIGRPARKPDLGHDALKPRHPHHPLHHLLHLPPQIHRPPIVDGEVIDKHPVGPDLHQPVQDAARAHVRRAAAEDAAQAGDGEEDGQRVDAVARDDGDAVPAPDAAGAHGGGEEADEVAQTRPAELDVRFGEGAFADLDAGGLGVFFIRGVAPAVAVAVAGEEDVLGEIEVDRGEPAGNGVHACVGVDDVVRAGDVWQEQGRAGSVAGARGVGVDEGEEVEGVVPEGDGVGARVAVEGVKGRKLEVRFGFKIGFELVHLRGFGGGVFPELARNGGGCRRHGCGWWAVILVKMEE